MPGYSGGPVVTNSCAFLHCTRGYGCIGYPAFPAPSFGRKIHAQLGRITPRDREVMFAVIARSGATKQSILSFPRCDGLLRCARNDDLANDDLATELLLAVRKLNRDYAVPAHKP